MDVVRADRDRRLLILRRRQLRALPPWRLEAKIALAAAIGVNLKGTVELTKHSLVSSFTLRHSRSFGGSSWLAVHVHSGAVHTHVHET